MTSVADRLSVTRDPGTEEHITIRWEIVEGSYICRRSMPGVNKSARLPALDADELLEVFKTIRDFLNRTLDEDYLIPGEIS